MEVQFVDRILTCSDCHGEFIFTAGEQLFFHDKQFKNDPKRCKPCKSRRSGLSAAANGAGPAAAGLSRTETRTECSECGVQTTVPFKPTQGRPVLCRQCFQLKSKGITASTAANIQSAAADIHMEPSSGLAMSPAETASALSSAATGPEGGRLTVNGAVSAAASMAAAPRDSSVATVADLASITIAEPLAEAPAPLAAADHIPTELLAQASGDMAPAEQIAPE